MNNYTLTNSQNTHANISKSGNPEKLKIDGNIIDLFVTPIHVQFNLNRRAIIPIRGSIYNI